MTCGPLHATLAPARRSGMVDTICCVSSEVGHAILGTGGVQVKQSVDRWSRLALVAAMTAALGLAGCGRKGPLDPPPSAGITPPPAYAPRPSLGEENYGPVPAPAGERPRTAVAAPTPTAPPPPPKTFPLDFLLAK